MRNRYKDHTCNTIHPDTERLAQANARSGFSDWEGDTLYGVVGQGLIITCVDHANRFMRMILLENRNQEATKDVIVKVLFEYVVHTLTLDNESEFAKFRSVKQILYTTVYFAHPAAPWERGSDENMNGKIRVYFPKRTNFHKITQEQLDKVTFILNSRLLNTVDKDGTQAHTRTMDIDVY
ncbi:IS30 family transposase [Megasphaera sueciensis]|uniref:IS30 family transposase n=1 Tax=Megasphaera sueciensis TaxID=349094 RepID=UPI003CFF4802